MNYKKILKSILPHLIIILIFTSLSYIYFSPLLINKELPQMDFIHSTGMSKELVDFEKNNPEEESLWTNSMFGGMPAYLIKGGKVFNIFHKLLSAARLGLPYTTVAIVFLYLIGFYVLLTTLKFNAITSLAGACGFAFASFNFIIIGVGHITQAYAIAFIAPVIAGVLLIYNKKYWAGSLLTLISLGMEVACSHPQITYYLLLSILVLALVKLVYAIKEKQVKSFGISSLILFSVTLLSIAPNIGGLLPIREYDKYSMRSPSELTQPEQQKTTGLDRDYAYYYSHGITETFSLFIPNIQGGRNSGFNKDSKTAETLQSFGVQNAKRMAESLYVPWGQISSSSPIYFGAIMCFLFLLGLFLVKQQEKYWLLIITIISILLAWGKNFTAFSDLFFYYFPFYNKFRSVNMILVIANFSVVLLGMLAIKEIIEEKESKAQLKKALKYSLIAIGGLLLIFGIMPTLFFDFQSVQDGRLVEQLNSNKWPQESIIQLIDAMKEDRISLFRKDVFRALFFILSAGSLIWLFMLKKIKALHFSLILAALILIDMWLIDKRYLNNDDFVSKKRANKIFAKTNADEFILSDADPNFRVLNLTQDVFNDAYTPYFHKSIGGYHGAKMRRYQDIIENSLLSDIAILQNSFSSNSIDTVLSTIKHLPVLNMLNTKYIIISPNERPIENLNRYGNCWFVKDIVFVNNANEEMNALKNNNLLKSVIIDNRYKSELNGFKPDNSDSLPGMIKLIQYKPNNLIYESKTSKNQLVVFSEIFYEKGWNVYIDNKPTPHFRVDYILRGLVIPAGEHKIEFKFQPKTFETARTISLASSILVCILVLGLSGGYIYVERKKEKTL